MECKKALVEADGDMDKAIDFLRERGLAAAQKKASRIAAEGVVLPYYDEATKQGVVLEVNSETDFVAKNEKFMNFVEGVAKTILATNPADVETLKEEKFNGTDRTVTETLNDLVLSIGENMKIRRFERMEGIVSTYIHAGGSVGVMVGFDVADESKAADAEFVAMGKNVAMQIAAMNPEYLSKADISDAEAEKMHSITVDSALNKPDSLPMPILSKLIDEAINDKNGPMKISQFIRVLIISRERISQTSFQRKHWRFLQVLPYLIRMRLLKTRFSQVLYRAEFLSRLRKFAS